MTDAGLHSGAVDPGLLAGFPILRTRDLSEAREVVGRAFCDHRLDIRQGTDLSVSHDHVSGQGLSLNALSYGAEVEIDPGQLGHFYLLQFPLAGAARVWHRGEEVDASARAATILNPDRDTRMIWGEGCRKLLLQMDRHYLEQVATGLLGGEMPGPIRFDPRVDLTRPEGLRLMRRVMSAAAAATRGELWAGRPGLQEAWAERELAAELLMLQPSNVSHMLWREARAPLRVLDLQAEVVVHRLAVAVAVAVASGASVVVVIVVVSVVVVLVVGVIQRFVGRPRRGAEEPAAARRRRKR